MTADWKLKRVHLECLVALSLAGLILCVYWQTQHHEFIDFDDQLYVTKNDLVRSGINLRSIAGAFKDLQTGNWHPVTLLSHMLDWRLFGDEAGGHHWTNVILHILNAVLLFLLWRMMTGALWSSAVVAALFAVHPIGVESVAWIAQRKNVLSTFFWLLTMIAYVRYARDPVFKRYLLVLVFFVLGLMSKAMLVTLPFVLLLMDFWPLNRTAGPAARMSSIAFSYIGKRVLVLSLEKVPLLMIGMAFVGLTAYAQYQVGAFASLESSPWSDRVANAFFAYSLYLKKWIWPGGLSVFYPLTAIPPWQALLAATLLGAVTIIVCAHGRKYPHLPVGWFWYLGTLLPVIGLFQIGLQSMADRYAYVPFIGLYVMAVWHAPRIFVALRLPKACAVYASLLIIVALATATFIRVGVWQSTTTLFEAALRTHPRNFMAYNILGGEAARRGDPERALEYYRTAMEINPRYARVYSNAGNVFLQRGQYREACDHYRKALAVNARYADAYYNLGVLHLLTDRPADAVELFHKALAIAPDYVDAHFNLGIALLKTGRVAEAVGHFEKAVEGRPGNAEARKALAIGSGMLKDLQK